MAVTLTAAQLAGAMRVGDSTEETAEVTRLLAFASEAVIRHAPDAPDTAHDESAIRLAAYLFDQPNAGRGVGYAHAGRNSGAWALLLPYRVHRAGSTGEAVAAAQAAVGTASNPVTNVTVNGADLVVTFADGTTETHDLPAGMGGTPGGTADLEVERLGTVESPTLPANRAWLATGVTVPDTVHVLMIDAGQVTDDYHLVDWDAVLLKAPSVAGQASAPGSFETFQGDAFTTLRIGHDGSNGLLVANDATTEMLLLHIHVERLLAPVNTVGSGGADQTARDAAATAQDRADDAFTAAGTAQTTADAARTAAANGLGITSLGSYTTTAQGASGDVQDTGIASPNTGQFLVVTVSGEEDVLWFSREFLHDHSGVPIPGGAQNDSVYITSIRAMRMGKTTSRNFALTNAFSSTLINAGVIVTFATLG